MDEVTAPLDSFHNGFFYFMRALNVLAKDADAQCREMGNFNVAWELHHDVSVGEYLAKQSYGQLTPEQSEAILALVHSLQSVPASELPGGSSLEHNMAAMQHPSWVPLRVQATSLVQLLQPITHRTQAFLRLSQGAR